MTTCAKLAHRISPPKISGPGQVLCWGRPRWRNVNHFSRRRRRRRIWLKQLGRSPRALATHLRFAGSAICIRTLSVRIWKASWHRVWALHPAAGGAACPPTKPPSSNCCDNRVLSQGRTREDSRKHWVFFTLVPSRKLPDGIASDDGEVNLMDILEINEHVIYRRWKISGNRWHKSFVRRGRPGGSFCSRR